MVYSPAGFVFDLWLHDLELLELKLFHFGFYMHCSSLWRTDTIVFAILNKPHLSNKPYSNVFEVNKPLQGLTEDLQNTVVHW